jgi:hypothetical protein
LLSLKFHPRVRSFAAALCVTARQKSDARR